MQYMIEMSGEVRTAQSKVYAIEADSAENAQELARQSFCSECCVDSGTARVVSVRENERTKRAIIAFVLMGNAIALSFVPWFAEGAKAAESITPDGASILLSIAIYSAFVVRFKGAAGVVRSWIDSVGSAMVCLLFASLIKPMMNDGSFSIFNETYDIKPIMVFGGAALFAWLGQKNASIISLGLCFALAMANYVTVNDAMGVWGVVYILCAVMGLLFYLSIEPVCHECLSSLKATAGAGRGYAQPTATQTASEPKQPTLPAKSTADSWDGEDVL